MALPSSTANWHWKNKNITDWSRRWMDNELTSVSVTAEKGEIVSISAVTEMDGDVELGQRKSKLITIFDTRISLSWTGKTSDGTEVSGSLIIPEVSHEILCDKLSGFQYQWSLDTPPSTKASALFAFAQTNLPAVLEKKLAMFPQAIIDTHGKDLTVSTEPSRTGTPTPSMPTNKPAISAVRSALSQPIRSGASTNMNTTTVTVSANLQASAEDLFSLLTDQTRIPSWTRTPAVSIAQPNSEYSFFGGGVQGKYTSLEPAKKIVQTWTLKSPTWPNEHYATLTTSFDQSNDSTKVTWNLDGVPLGSEDEIERNIKGYYIHGLKSIGYVELFVPQSSYVPSKRAFGSPSWSSTEASSIYLSTIIIGALVLTAAFSIPYLSSAPASK